jgi:hypothetical protein
MTKYLLAISVITLLAACSSPSVIQSSYVGQENRDIKALAPSEIAGLLNGKGLGYAKSAELNGYPGPAHVLEVSSKLNLTAKQMEETRAIFSRMESAAKQHGAELVQAEAALEALFRSREVTNGSLTRALQQVTISQAKVRQSHLVAHIEQTKLLSTEQVAKYIELRGYSAAAHTHSGHQ